MIKQIIPDWYDTPGAMEVLGVSREAISKIAKAKINGWQSVPVGNGNATLHRAEDVHQYRDHQIRTRLVTALGWKGQGFYRVDDVDISCPICNAFAVQWPATPYLAEKFRCINKHEGEL